MHPWKAAYQFFINIFKRKTAKIKQVSRLSSFNSVLIKPSREATDDLLKPGTLLIVKDGTFYRWARFTCPCGCGQKQVISLQSNHSPHWSIAENGTSVTLHPSVHVNGNGGCGAHFFVRNNRIDWV